MDINEYYKGDKMNIQVFDSKNIGELYNLVKPDNTPTCPECHGFMAYDMDGEYHCDNDNCVTNNIKGAI